MTNQEVDVIFAGGGAVACVAAGRLAQADPNLKILILESGPLTQDKPDHVQPGRYFRNLKRSLAGEYEHGLFTLHTSKPSPALAGRSVTVPMARCLGGGSSVNFTVYTRAAASDYDDWEKVYGNPGWGSKHLIPLLKKAETYQVTGKFPTHGTQGPIKVSYAPTRETNVASEFLRIAGEYDPERKFTEDVNGFYECNVYGRWPRYIDKASGRRSDTPHHYIYDNVGHTGLEILERRRVVRVIFDGLRAVGVEHASELEHHPKATKERNESSTTISYASQLIVVSAGAFGSPAILERSGVGAADVLRRNNIQQIVELPGVGEHYMDHNVVFTPYLATEDADTMDVIFRGSDAEVEAFTKHWETDGQGLMAQNGLDAGIKLRPNLADLKEIGPNFDARWKSYFEGAPDKPVMWLGTFSTYAGNYPLPGVTALRKYFSAVYYVEYPVSTGHVHISNGLDPYGKLDFEPGYLNDATDIGILRWGYKKGREFARRMGVYRGEYVPGHPTFPDGSKATPQTYAKPVPVLTPDIDYSVEDDRAIDEYHRRAVETAWHSIGTCAMKQREEGGVVDSRLNVYGVQHLKVAALAIGEKAALIISQDLGILGV